MRAGTPRRCDPGCANTEKKGICAPMELKKCLRKRAGVLFFAAIKHCAGDTALTDTFEE
jgi:hypothetical protein